MPDIILPVCDGAGCSPNLDANKLMLFGSIESFNLVAFLGTCNKMRMFTLVFFLLRFHSFLSLSKRHLSLSRISCYVNSPRAALLSRSESFLPPFTLYLSGAHMSLTSARYLLQSSMPRTSPWISSLLVFTVLIHIFSIKMIVLVCKYWF